MRVTNYIDHTLLKIDATSDNITHLCKEAKDHQFYAVCVPPYYVELASTLLNDTKVKVATVVGFPTGYAALPAKIEEIKRSISQGADEIDVVINIAAVKSGDWKYVKNEITSLTTAVHLQRKVIKLIIEATLLTEVEIAQVCAICSDAGVDYVKNATGHNGKATIKLIHFLRTALPKRVKIKASAGIRTATFAKRLIEVGADRIGTSSGVAIAEEELATSEEEI